MSVMPRSSAARIVPIDSISSLPPHFQPPIAQVPSAMREISTPVPAMAANSMLRSRNLALLPIVGLLSSAVVFALVAHARLDITLPCGVSAAGLRTVPGLKPGVGPVALAAGRLAERSGTENDHQQKRTHDGMLAPAHDRRVSPPGAGVTGETSPPRCAVH